MHKGRPIVEAIERFKTQQNISFHVPGHKHGLLSRLPSSIQSALGYDLTELTGLDDLHHPEEVIQEAEELLQETYQSDRSFLLVNGSTVGNLAMIYAVCKKGEQVIVQRNAHKSIFHALELVGASPIFVSPEWDPHTRTATHVSMETLEKALAAYPNTKAVLLTYPTYYGVTSHHLKSQVELCHRLDIPVLVDEAHGAHFQADEGFPRSALQCGADVVVQSAHKTLPAMTMASFLHVNSRLIHAEQIQHYLRMLQSSSPSYLLLASLDDARHYVQTYAPEDFTYFMEKRRQFVDSLRMIHSLEVIEVEDPLKLMLRVKGFAGFDLQHALEQEQIFSELADPEQVLFILPLLKRNQSYPFAEARSKIKNAVVKLNEQVRTKPQMYTNPILLEKITVPERSYEQMQTQQHVAQWIPYMRTMGYISASMLIPYPPGIPLLVPGEKITIEKLKQLEEYLSLGASFQGNHQLHERKILVINPLSEE